jgi:hypothetical protein
MTPERMRCWRSAVLLLLWPKIKNAVSNNQPEKFLDTDRRGP